MKWCERCGGPLREGSGLWDGCRLCALERHTEQMQMLAMMPHWLRWRGLVERAHQPCPHASGWWLPEGARDNPEGRPADDAARLGFWLMNAQGLDPTCYAWD